MVHGTGLERTSPSSSESLFYVRSPYTR